MGKLLLSLGFFFIVLYLPCSGQPIFVPAHLDEWNKVAKDPEFINDSSFLTKEIHTIPYSHRDVPEDLLPHGTFIKLELQRKARTELSLFQHPPFDLHFTSADDKTVLVLLNDSLQRLSDPEVRLRQKSLSYDPKLRGFDISPRDGRDTLHIIYGGHEYAFVIFPKYSGYYPSFGRGNGYVITSQPVYRISDTLRAKAYLVHDRKAVKKKAYAKLYYARGGPIATYTLKAKSPGAFVLNVPLGDSLKSDMDYTLKFFEETQRLMWQCDFRIEDFSFEAVEYELTPVHKLHRPGNSFHLIFSATDALGLPAHSAKLKLRVEFGGLRHLHSPEVSFPSPLFSTETTVENERKILIEIPDSVFSENIDFSFKVIAEMSHPSGVFEQREFNFEHKSRPLPFKYEIQGNYLHLYPTEAPADSLTLVAKDARKELRRTVSLPFSFPLRKELKDLRIITEHEELSLGEMLPATEVKMRFRQSLDSVEIRLLNPAGYEMEVSFGKWSRRTNSFSSFATDTSFSIERSKRGDPFIRVDYINRNGLQSIKKTFRNLREQLFIEHSFPKALNAGTTRKDSITVTNFLGQPVENTNLTVLSLDDRFNQSKLPIWGKHDHYSKMPAPVGYSLLNPPPGDYNSHKLHKRYIHHFRKGNKYTDFYWGVFQDEVPNPAGLTGIAPVVAEIGNLRKPIYAVIDDSTIFHFEFERDYPIQLEPGTYNIGFRTESHYYQFDSVKVFPGELTVLRGSEIPELGEGRNARRPSSPTEDELKLLLKNYRLFTTPGDLYRIQGRDSSKVHSRYYYNWQRRYPQDDSFRFVLEHLDFDTTISSGYDHYSGYDNYPPKGDYEIVGKNFTLEEFSKYVGIITYWRSNYLGAYDFQAKEQGPRRSTSDYLRHVVAGQMNPVQLPVRKQASVHHFVFNSAPKNPYRKEAFRAIALYGDSIPVLAIEDSETNSVKLKMNGSFEIFAKPLTSPEILYRKTAEASEGQLHFHKLDPDTTYEYLQDDFREYWYPEGHFRDWILSVSSMDLGLYRKGWLQRKNGRSLSLRIDSLHKPDRGIDGLFYLKNEEGEVVLISTLMYDGHVIVQNLKPAKYQAELHTAHGDTIQLPPMDLINNRYFNKHLSITKDGEIQEDDLYKEGEDGMPLEVIIRSKMPLIDKTKNSTVTTHEDISNMAVREVSSVSSVLPGSRVTAISENDPAEVVSLVEDEFETKDGWQQWAAEENRSDFREVALWEANLLTDDEGKAVIKNKWPGNITTWSNHVYAAIAHRYSGYSHSYTRGLKPLSTQLSLPRFTVQGDSFVTNVQVLNLTGKDQEYSMNIRYAGKNLYTGNSRVAKVLHHEIGVKVTDTATISSALETGGGYRDGEEHILAPGEKGILQTLGASHLLTKGKPQWIKAEEYPLNIEVSLPSFDFAAAEIRYLSGYAHGCNEQMSNRLRALLINEAIGGQKLIDFPEVEIRKLLGLLEGNQNEEGLWGWWGKSESNPNISRIVVEVLVLAKKYGYRTTSLRKLEATGFFGYTPDMARLKIAAELDMTHRFKDYILNYQCADATCLIDLAVLKQQIGLAFDMDTLLKLAETFPSGGYFWRSKLGTFSNSFYYTVLMAELLHHAEGYDQDYARALLGVLSFRKSGFRLHTNDAANFVEFMSELKQEFEKSRLLVVRGDSTDTSTFNAFPLQLRLSPGDSVLLENTEGGFLLASERFEKWQTKARRGIFNMTSSWHQDAAAVDSLANHSKTSLKVSFSNSYGRRYMMLEVPLPAGCSFDQENFTKPYRARHTEFFRDRCVIYYAYLPAGSHELTFPVLPRFEGSFTQNPVRLRSMYEEELDDWTAIRRVVIYSSEK